MKQSELINNDCKHQAGHKGSSLTSTLLCVREEDKVSLQDILQYSPFKTLAELLLEVDAISSVSLGKIGTRIIIWNLRRSEA